MMTASSAAEQGGRSVRVPSKAFQVNASTYVITSFRRSSRLLLGTASSTVYLVLRANVAELCEEKGTNG